MWLILRDHFQHPYLFLPWSPWYLWLETKIFLPHLSQFLPWFSLLLPRLICWETSARSRAWQPPIKLLTGIHLCICNVSISRKKTCPWSKLTSGEVGARWSPVVCLGCENNTCLFSYKLSRGRAELLLDLSVPLKHQLSITCMYMKAFSQLPRCCVFLWPEDEFV